MTITIKFQTPGQALMQASHLHDVPESATFVWYDFQNPSESENEIFKSYFNFNKLEIDDTVNGTPRAKYKTYDAYQYIVLHSIDSKSSGNKALNLFIKEQVLITYHHQPFSILTDLTRMLTTDNQNGLQTFNIALHIIDKMVDSYFDLIYEIEDKVYEFEDYQLKGTSVKDIMEEVFKIRSNIIKMKRIVYPIQELVDNIKESSLLLVDETNHMYIQHVEDHIIKQQNILKMSQEMTDEIKDNYSSYNSFKMNSIMQILTLVSVIFLPLTLITGIYGMNFTNMPELKWHYGYYIVLTIMLAISLGCIYYFKKEKWF